MRIFDKIQEKNNNNENVSKNNKHFYKLKRILQTNNIYIRLFSVMILCTVIPCIIIGVWANYYLKNALLNNYMEEYLNSVYVNVTDGINHYIDQISAYSVYIFSDGVIYSIINDNTVSENEKKEKIQKYLNENWNNNLIANLDIVKDGNIIRKSDENIIMPESNYNADIKHTNILILNESAEGENNEKYIVFGRTVYNMSREREEFDLYIYVPEKELYNALSEFNNDNNLLFLTANDKVILHADSDKLGSYVIFPDNKVFDNNMSKRRMNEFFYDYKPISLKIATEGQWVIESRMNYKELYQSTNKLQLDTMILLSIAILFAIILAIVIPISLLKSISTLKARMAEFVESGGENQKARYTFEEIRELEESFTAMVFEINDLMKRNVMEKENQRKAELKALQAQINPHFIYNALDAIAWYAKIEKQSYIATMVCELATFFRISLHKGDTFITLNEEIRHVESYVAIEQMRFPGMIEINYKIQEDLLDKKVLKIILQPIVENCIKHGFENMDNGGEINITAYSDGDDIIFEVEDNGHGTDMNPLSDEYKDKRGYGLKNVNERIQLEYGKNYGIVFRSTKNEGTIVSIRIKSKN